MSLYRVTFHVGDAFEAAILADPSELDAVIDREAGKLPWNAAWEIERIAEASAIPARFIGRLLDEDEGAELDRALAMATPKKPPAPSGRQRVGRHRRRV